MRTLRITVGFLGWLLLVAGAVVWTRSPAFPLPNGGAELTHDLWQFASAKRRIVPLTLAPSVWIQAGDPIYVIDANKTITQVGEILAVPPIAVANRSEVDARPLCAKAMFYPSAPDLTPQYQLTGYVTPRSLDWVLKTMLPPEKRVAISHEILYAYEAYHDEILDALKPVALASVREVAQVVQQQLRLAVAAHRDELEQLGSEYQQTILKNELLPLIRAEIWPTVKKHAEPLANDIGQEIWARASLWSFGWRYVYDRSPLPEKNLTRAEWNRFVHDDVVPVLRQHSEQFIAIQRQILVDIIQNQKVRRTVQHDVRHVLEDKKFKAIVWEILREAIIDNQQVHAVVRRQWQSQEAQEVVRLTSARIETCIRRIGDLLFGTRETGIAPEFAQVLRNQILDKDCRWFVLERRPETPPATSSRHQQLMLQVHRGTHPQINPFAVTLHGTHP